MPMSDADLVRLAHVVLRAEVVDKTIRMERDGNEDLPYTVVTLRRLELFKGDLDEAFQVLLPGGIAEGVVWGVPGTPGFDVGQEVVLALHPLPGRAGEYGLSEFGLSKFDVVTDQAGRRFVVRPVFGSREDLALSKRDSPLLPASTVPGGSEEAVPARDAESFFAGLRGIRSGEALSSVAYAIPSGGLESHRVRLRTKWANVGGVEPGDCGGQPCMFKWFFENGGSPNATLFLTGTQSRLVPNYAPCGSDQKCLAQYVVDQWHGVANTDIRIDGVVASGGKVEIVMDQDLPHLGAAWSTPYDCMNGGAVGIGGPTSQGQARTFKGLTPYYAAGGGKVSMRRWTCDYPTMGFIQVLLHEVGHVLCLHHPDQYRSVHSTTTPAQWDAAVMRSSTHPAPVLTPQTDDIQAMQFYYGTAAPGPLPVASFSYSPSPPSAGAPVTFTDTTTNSPTGWLWFFGEPSSSSNFSRDKNPTHTYAGPGTYTVDLIAGSLNGGSRTTKQVTVGGAIQPCVASATALCLTNKRFKVEVQWTVPDQGRSGVGTAVRLTDDTGYFWFFDSANIELVLKALDARGVNQFFWVFYGALSNVEYTITVTDTQTGAVRMYHNPDKTLASFADTAAFPGLMIGPDEERVSVERAPVEAIGAESPAELYAIYAAQTKIAVPVEAACAANSTTLCLNQGRFRLQVDWVVPSQGQSGHGMAVPVTGDTGYFWFFSATNVELVIKVLDARGVNSHFWVFYGALSNVEYTITVTDTQTQAIRMYHNPDKTLASFADTAAF
jgi:PKD repeat protein